MNSTFTKAIKQVLKEIDQFLTNTLRDQNLNKVAQKERTKLLESLQKLYNDYADVKPNVEKDDTRSSTANPRLSSLGFQSSEDGDCNDDNIPQTTVSALKSPTKIGYLLQRKIGGDKKLFKPKKEPKKYCVVHHGIMYWFLKPSDKTYHGAVALNGCEIRDVSRKEKEFVFQLDFTDSKKCYEFQADSRDDIEEWKTAVETGINYYVEYVDGDSMPAISASSSVRELTANEEEVEYLEPDNVVSYVGNHFKNALELRSSIPRESPPSPPKKDIPLPLPKHAKIKKAEKDDKKSALPKSQNDKSMPQNTKTSALKPRTISEVKLNHVSLPTERPTVVHQCEDDGDIYDSVDTTTDVPSATATAAPTGNTLQRSVPDTIPPKLPQRGKPVYANQSDSDNDNLIYELG